jgi:hypothetical protein
MSNKMFDLGGGVAPSSSSKTPTTPTKRLTASELLAAFSPRRTRTSASQTAKDSSSPMALRQLQPIGYLESDDSELSSAKESSYSGSDDESDADETITSPSTPQSGNNGPSSPSSLRNGLRPLKSTTQTWQPKKATHGKLSEKQSATFARLASKKDLKRQILDAARAKEDKFLVHNKDAFLRLLPEVNYIQKLLINRSTSEESIGQVPFEQLAVQPEG